MSKVLIVDDDAVVRHVTTAMLQSEGHDVLEASDGLYVAEIIAKEKPDILLTDLIMLEQEGLTTIMQVRSSTPELPIIAMSVKAEYLNIAKLLGADAVLGKPLDKLELNALIGELTTP